jgi:Baseplate J-like protein
MAEPFVTTGGEIDAASLKQEILELFEAAFPGWESSSGGLLTLLAEGQARINADVFEQMTELEQAAFKRFGEAIASVPPVQAAAATVGSVWTMIDELGHEIPAGTLVGIPGPEGRPIGFETVGDTVVAPGSTKVAVLLEAVEAGESGNGLSGEAQLETQLAFVEAPGGVELEGVTSGGVDEEEEDAYLNRLVEELRTISVSLIKAPDFETDARSIAGIARAKCLEAYNAEEGKEEAMAVSVFAIDASGNDVAGPVKEALEARQTDKLLSGINYYVGSPTYTTIDVVAGVVVETGFDPTAVVAAVGARLAEYFNPGKWGMPKQGDSGSGWINQTHVYFNEVISEIDRVGGVDRVVSVLLGGTGGGKAFTVEASTDVFTTSVEHGYALNDAVIFRAGVTGTAPLEAGKVYYARDITAKTFKLAKEPGGAAINITSDGSGTVVRMRTLDLTLNGVVSLPTLKTAAVSAV